MKTFLASLSFLIIGISFKAQALENYECINKEKQISIELNIPVESHLYNESSNVCNGGVGDVPVCEMKYYIREENLINLKIMMNSQIFNKQMLVNRYKWGEVPDYEEKMHFSGNVDYVLDLKYHFTLSSSTFNEDYLFFVTAQANENPILLRCK